MPETECVCVGTVLMSLQPPFVHHRRNIGFPFDVTKEIASNNKPFRHPFPFFLQAENYPNVKRHLGMQKRKAIREATVKQRALKRNNRFTQVIFSLLSHRNPVSTFPYTRFFFFLFFSEYTTEETAATKARQQERLKFIASESSPLAFFLYHQSSNLGGFRGLWLKL